VKVNFLTENTVEITLEVVSRYNKSREGRTIFGNAYMIEQFESQHPNKKVLKVLKGHQLDNFTKTGTFSGTWVFELEKPPAPKKVATPKKQSTKKKKTSLK
jgi:hypothetical protein